MEIGSYRLSKVKVEQDEPLTETISQHSSAPGDSNEVKVKVEQSEPSARAEFQLPPGETSVIDYFRRRGIIVDARPYCSPYPPVQIFFASTTQASHLAPSGRSQQFPRLSGITNQQYWNWRLTSTALHAREPGFNHRYPYLDKTMNSDQDLAPAPMAQHVAGSNYQSPNSDQNVTLARMTQNDGEPNHRQYSDNTRPGQQYQYSATGFVELGNQAQEATQMAPYLNPGHAVLEPNQFPPPGPSYTQMLPPPRMLQQTGYRQLPLPTYEPQSSMAYP